VRAGAVSRFRSLYWRFAAAFTLLFAVLALVAVLGIDRSTRLYHQEATQRLHRDLAGWIVAHYGLDRSTEPDPAIIEQAFGAVMHVNPTIEVYLLDGDGGIRAFNAPTGSVRAERVDMAPLRAYFADPDRLPVLGDDPRNPGTRRIFSVAPMGSVEAMTGYLYVVIGGASYQSFIEHFRASHILRLTVGLALAAALAGAAWGLLSFRVLTRRVRHLAAALESFRNSAFVTVPASLPPARENAGDELERLAASLRGQMELIVRQIAQLREADSRMREMVASLSHDLRTPLTSLGGYLDTVLLKDGTLSTAERCSHLTLAASCHARLRQLVDALFELARLEIPGVQIDLVPTSLTDLVLDVAQKFSLRAAELGLTLEVDVPEELPQVRADVGLVERALENLIANALRHTPHGGRVRLAVAPAGPLVRVTVADTGEGIAPEQLAHLFDRPYRSGRARPALGGGAGLGLAITRRIVELHGGRLSVESEVGRGSAFTFTLAAVPEAAARALAGAAPAVIG
jgi:signal transduction histidine kinase